MIGVDLTPEMVAWVTENARKMGAANVTFLLGDIEALPFSNTSVDVVLSNCVINLAPNKSQALLRGVSGAPTWRSAGGNGVGVVERLASRVGKGSASLCPVLDRCDFGRGLPSSYSSGRFCARARGLQRWYGADRLALGAGSASAVSNGLPAYVGLSLTSKSRKSDWRLMKGGHI